MENRAGLELVYRGRYRMYRATGAGLPSSTHIVCCNEASGILYRPHIAGMELQVRMERMAGVFIDAAWRLALKGKKASSAAELMLLSGGLFYQLNSGFRKKFRLALPQCFLGIKRQRLEGTEGGFSAVATYENFESLPDNANIIIGDTIATGATLQKAVGYLLAALAERKSRLESLTMCSLACSVKGAQAVKEAGKSVLAAFPEAKVHLVVAEELFHLMPDGTDMRFLYPGAVMPQETRGRILRLYGEELGREMKCAVFDWGTRCKNPIRHYAEFLEFSQVFLSVPRERKSAAVVNRMEREAEKALARMEKRL
jgi:hypothetical protein